MKGRHSELPYKIQWKNNPLLMILLFLGRKHYFSKYGFFPLILFFSSLNWQHQPASPLGTRNWQHEHFSSKTLSFINASPGKPWTASICNTASYTSARNNIYNLSKPLFHFPLGIISEYVWFCHWERNNKKAVVKGLDGIVNGRLDV